MLMVGFFTPWFPSIAVRFVLKSPACPTYLPFFFLPSTVLIHAALLSSRSPPLRSQASGFFMSVRPVSLIMRSLLFFCYRFVSPLSADDPHVRILNPCHAANCAPSASLTNNVIGGSRTVFTVCEETDLVFEAFRRLVQS